ncbi:hypothetical protein RISK_005607 [Rhodopirellula islandica]|uniref:Transmembrane protein n=1 Tax=Rhodopirellula islandica TaxID=595434 RepID=A0A0J1B7W1_RHOIS|nr:O-antigen polysaccharide polymerase Wzy [Rhodopirellula islandica]KLU02541.1 hypothetical protein RISK_005607 [Rhodopirellula islandica]
MIDARELLAPNNIYKFVAVVTLPLAVGLAVCGWLLMDNRFHLVAIGVFAPCVFCGLLGVIHKQMHWAEPVHLILLYMIVGTTGASVFLSFGEGARREFLLSGEVLSFFIRGAIWVLLGVVAFVIAYLATRMRAPVVRLVGYGKGSYRPASMFILALCLATASLLATVKFVQMTGGISVDQLSQKRWQEVQGESGTVYGGGGYYRALAGLPVPLLLLHVASLLHTRRRPSLVDISVLVLLFGSAIAMPFLSNSRSGVVFIVLEVAVVVVIVRGLNPRVIMPCALVMLFLFGVMSYYRSLRNNRIERGDSNPIMSLASSGNGLSVVGTSIITGRVPEQMEYKWGFSYLTWVTTPIPRSYWPEKPNVGLGREIKAKLVASDAREQSGRPPGFLGEGYINFGPIGLVFAAVGFGFLARMLWNSFQSEFSTNPLAVAMYVVLMPPLCQFVNSGFSEMVVRLLTEGASLWIVTFPLFLSRSR